MRGLAVGALRTEGRAGWGEGGPPPYALCKSVNLKEMLLRSVQECDSKGVRLTGDG